MPISGGDALRPAAQRAEAYLEQGLRHYELWQAEEALCALRHAIRLVPTNPDYHLHLARACARFGQFDQALEALKGFLQYEDPSNQTAIRLRRLVQEQEVQAEIRNVRERLAAQLAEIESRRKAMERQVASELAATVERVRREAQWLRRWLQWNLAKAVGRDLLFSPSGKVIVRKGEAISEQHQTLLELAVQEYVRDAEMKSQEEQERRQRDLDADKQRAEKAAEREIRAIQEQSDAIADAVEISFVNCMGARGLGPAEIQAARHMWLEFRICAGRAPIPMRKPETWAAGVDYTVQRVNFRQVSVEHLARLYRVSRMAVRARHAQLLEVLDIMPCDYRYFVGQENPLDHLVEAALMLEELERRFHETPES